MTEMHTHQMPLLNAPQNNWILYRSYCTFTGTKTLDMLAGRIINKQTKNVPLQVSYCTGFLVR